MSIAVDWDVKNQTKQTINYIGKIIIMQLFTAVVALNQIIFKLKSIFKQHCELHDLNMNYITTIQLVA